MFPGAGVSLTESSRGSWQSFGTAGALSAWAGLRQQRQGVLPTPQGCSEDTAPAPNQCQRHRGHGSAQTQVREKETWVKSRCMKRAQAGLKAQTPPVWLPLPGSPSTSSSSWEIPAKKTFGEERAKPSLCWAGGITPAMGTGVGSSLLNVSSMATLGEGANLSFTHLFPVFTAALVACGSGHPQEDPCTWTGDTWAGFGQMKSQFKLTEGFLNQRLVFSVSHFLSPRASLLTHFPNSS